MLSESSVKGQYYLGLFKQSMKYGFLPVLSNVYNSYSRAKSYAYNDCVEIVFSYARKISEDYEDGYKWKAYDWGIIAHNLQTFTFGAILRKYDKFNNCCGVIHMVITKENVFII